MRYFSSLLAERSTLLETRRLAEAHKDLKKFKSGLLFDDSREGSSVGEHTTEARGVGGSIPSLPIKPRYSLRSHKGSIPSLPMGIVL